MPRRRQPGKPAAGHGGTRTGNPGASYSNRTDLQRHQGTIPQRVATNQTYGRATQQQEAMRQQPLAAAPQLIPPGVQAPAGTFGPPPSPSSPSSGPGAGGGGLSSLAALAGAPNVAGPQGQPSAHPLLPASPLPPLDRPSERPNEPVTAGSATGPGPGPSALPTGPVAAGGTSLSTMLSAIAQQSNSPSVQALAQRATGAGL